MTYRCDSCGINWLPYMTQAGACPSCGGGTRRLNEPSSDNAMALHRALRAKGRSADMHERFEQFYADRERSELDSLERLVNLPSFDHPERS